MTQSTMHEGRREDPPGSQNAPEGQDFVWRFKLDEKPPTMLLDHPLDELLRVQWEELLKLCVPHFDGKPVKIDSFATMRDPKKLHPVFADAARAGQGADKG